MKSLNKVQLIGNLTADPEIKVTGNGVSIASFSVATNREWTDKSGNKVSEVEFSNIVVFAKLAEVCEKYLKKGSPVFIEGRLKTQTWDDKDSGKKMYRTEIIGENLIMLPNSKAKKDNDNGEDLPFDTKEDDPLADF